MADAFDASAGYSGIVYASVPAEARAETFGGQGERSPPAACGSGTCGFDVSAGKRTVGAGAGRGYQRVLFRDAQRRTLLWQDI